MSHDVPDARAWAIEQHGDQRYGKGESARPYAYHLEAVATIAAPYGQLAEIVAWLHDVIEDTDATEETVAAKFGAQVARLVSFVTNPAEVDKSRMVEERNKKLAGLKDDDSVALIVKAADRLANLRESVKPGEKSEKMLAKYRGEHHGLRLAAFRPGLCDAIWQEIDSIVA